MGNLGPEVARLIVRLTSRYQSASSSTSTLASTTTPPSTTTSAAQSSGKSDSGLSPGAAAGIGVGCTIALLLLAFGFWLMYRRGLNKGRRAQDAKESPSEARLKGLDAMTPSNARRAELEHETPMRHEAWVPWNLEMDGRSPPSEMEDGHGRVELP